MKVEFKRDGRGVYEVRVPGAAHPVACLFPVRPEDAPRGRNGRPMSRWSLVLQHAAREALGAKAANAAERSLKGQPINDIKRKVRARADELFGVLVSRSGGRPAKVPALRRKLP